MLVEILRATTIAQFRRTKLLPPESQKASRHCVAAKTNMNGKAR